MSRLGFYSFITLFVIGSLTVWDANAASRAAAANPAKPIVESHENTILSPFRNSMAYVRWNSGDHRNRDVRIREYAPFFHTLHFSIPEEHYDYLNMTDDTFRHSMESYQGVADTMSHILKQSELEKEGNTGPQPESVTNPHQRPASEIDGLMYYHFDSWLSPLDFANEDRNNVWLMGGVNQNPRYLCTNTTERHDWLWFGQGAQGPIRSALKAVANDPMGYVVPPDNKLCYGWADIYWIPRRFFRDWIYLANIFNLHRGMHEMAVPTILTIIDLTYRTHETRPLLTRIGDCYGGCCSVAKYADDDVLFYRCGHKLDHLNMDTVNAQTNRLREQAAMLGQPFNATLQLEKPNIQDNTAPASTGTALTKRAFVPPSAWML